MKLPTPKRIRIEDYAKEFKDLIEKLAFPINSSLSTLFEMGNKRITLKDNIAATVISFTTRVDANGIPQNNIFLNADVTLQSQLVEGVSVIDVFATDGVTLPNAGVFVDWSPSKTGIIVNSIKGLPANVEFTIKLVIYN